MEKVLIIGAAGYIGARLSALLANEGREVTAVCFPIVPESEEWVALMRKVKIADVTSDKEIDELTDIHYDAAIHLVSLDHHDSNQDPGLVNSVNVLPVWNLLEHFKRKQTLKRFIYFSTIHVYGKITQELITEDSSTNPLTTYALTHLMAENICSTYNASSEIECVNLRLSNSYGDPFFHENSCWWLVVNDLCRTAYLDKKIILKSDGSTFRDFIHYRDIFGAIKKLLASDEGTFKKNNTFHLSSGKTYSILEIAEMVRDVYYQLHNDKISIVLPEKKDIEKKNKPSRYCISNDRLLSIGYEPKVQLEQGILDLFRYLKEYYGN